MNMIQIEKSKLVPVFKGDDTIAYRDPCCYYEDGTYYLFMTVSHKRDGYMYNTVGVSKSNDLRNWSNAKTITDFDISLNYCSPGSVLKTNDGYIICVTSYPMPFPYEKQFYADETARLFTIHTKDFKNFSKPKPIMAKGDTKIEDMGRMIDPFIFRDLHDDSLFHLLFKQNGVSISHSKNFKYWEYDGHTEAGENACIIIKDNLYYLIHSPENGIGLKISSDLKIWEDKGITTLNQSCWEWASGRLTAAFAMEAPEGIEYKYIVFFHGSRKECFPETHGAASIGIVYTNDFLQYYCIE